VAGHDPHDRHSKQLHKQALTEPTISRHPKPLINVGSEDNILGKRDFLDYTGISFTLTFNVTPPYGTPSLLPPLQKKIFKKLSFQLQRNVQVPYFILPFPLIKKKEMCECPTSATRAYSTESDIDKE